MDEDYDPDIRDDILKPASTRSKIVVNLKEPKDKTTGKKRAFEKGDKIEYELDPYDKVRMRLLKENEQLYKQYQETILKLESTPQYQPKKRSVPCYLKWPIIFVEFILILVLIYAFFLVIQLALFNLVILGIIFVVMRKFIQILEAFRWKFQFSYKTKEFNAFIKEENLKYQKMNIEIIPDREGQWLEFLLKEEE